MHDLMRTGAVAIVLLALMPVSGCKKQEAASPMLAAPAAAKTMAVASGDADRRIAFTYSFGIELPSDAVQAVQQKNLADCRAAGCTVLNTQLNRSWNGAVHASISVRIAPDRYQAFADGITAPPARLVSHTETAEDETIPFLDVEKRLDAQMALRDRLLQMQKQAGSTVADLVAVEKQLADVQGTIESETVQRDYLRTITDTVKVDVAYNGLIQQAGPFDISPVRAALDNFAPNVIQSIGDMLVWLGLVLPWLPLAVLAGWGIRRIVRRRFP